MYLQSPKIVYGNQKFIILSNSSTIYSSTDGINWNSPSISTPVTSNWRDFKYVDDKFIALTNNNYYLYSEDGTVWSLEYLPSAQPWNSIAFGIVGNDTSNTQLIPQSLNKHYVIYNKTIAPAETHEIKGGITLSSGDQIRVYSDSPEIIANAYGVEIS
jgi:predicted GH43/DUF377 family glycosyl hydrolase